MSPCDAVRRVRVRVWAHMSVGFRVVAMWVRCGCMHMCKGVRACMRSCHSIPHVLHAKLVLQLLRGVSVYLTYEYIASALKQALLALVLNFSPTYRFGVNGSLFKVLANTTTLIEIRIKDLETDPLTGFLAR